MLVAFRKLQAETKEVGGCTGHEYSRLEIGIYREYGRIDSEESGRVWGLPMQPSATEQISGPVTSTVGTTPKLLYALKASHVDLDGLQDADQSWKRARSGGLGRPMFERF